MKLFSSSFWHHNRLLIVAACCLPEQSTSAFEAKLLVMTLKTSEELRVDEGR
jgi:hypothetical protein